MIKKYTKKIFALLLMLTLLPILSFANSPLAAQHPIVVVGAPAILTSTVGQRWTSHTIDQHQYFLKNIIWQNDHFYSFVHIDGEMTFYRDHPAISSDGIHWQLGKGSLETFNPQTIFSVDGKLYALTNGGAAIVTSEDGLNWQKRSDLSQLLLSRVVHVNKQFVAVGIAFEDAKHNFMDGYIGTSSDGKKFDAVYKLYNVHIDSLAYGNGRYVAVGFSETSDATFFVVSTDGRHWQKIEGQFPAKRMFEITYGSNGFVAVGEDSYIMHSQDGIKWTIIKSAVSGTTDLRSVNFTHDLYVAVGFSSTAGQHSPIWTSTDGVNWIAQDSNTVMPLYGVV